ncbi:MAG TPA: zonular occludens toxin domain-containing protein [Burkholderiaceae bacterium]|nr:zonular occludens toxin domain-containing protein [Burkholderiaceae bacterium]
MIRLFTGKPGHGKSNHAVSVALREIREGRAVYVSNVNGMRIPGAIPFEDPRQWQELPAGALLIVDEAQRFWRATRTGTVSPEVYAMETHRHLGIDLLLITQDPLYLVKHLRGLVGEHVHHVRRSKGVVQTFTWGNRCSESPESPSEQEVAEQGLFTLDAEAFRYYESTEQDTHRPKLPRKVWFIGGALVLVLAMFTIGPSVLKRVTIGKSTAETGGPPPQASGLLSAVAGRGRSSSPASVEEYVARQAPRVVGAPWSAPLFDERAAASDPQLFCMLSQPGHDADGSYRENSSCTCITEQGTRYRMELQACAQHARSGGVYNPFRMPQQQLQQPQQPQQYPPQAAQAGLQRAPVAMPTFGGGDVGTGPRPGVDPTFGTMTRPAM